MKLLSVLLTLLLAAPLLALTEDDFLKPVGKPPKAKPQMRQGGEALPPLPLPATPLRRSEKKRPPAPATLIGKVIWGGYKDFKWDNGQVTRVYDWNMVPADCQQLLATARRQLGMKYKVQTVRLDNFTATPAEIPVLYFCGGRRLRLSDGDRQVLRQYMLDGGMVWFDSIVGSPFFYTSAVQELKKIFPEVSLRRLPPDHPVFHMVDSTVQVNVVSKEEIPPVLDGLYIGSRLAAVVSPYGMGCGWDDANPELIAKADYYDPAHAKLMGLNLVAYAVGWFRAGQAHAKAGVFRTEDKLDNPGALRFARIRHNGVWNTEPGATGNLLRFIARNQYVQVNYKEEVLQPGKDPLGDLPFLYMAGIGDFAFSEEQAAALRRYLLDGGYLFVNNSLGIREFDVAFRKQLQRLLPGAELTRIPLDHPLFQEGPHRIGKIDYSLAARARHPDQHLPYLEGIELDGDLRVIYSRFDLAAGWQGDEHPMAEYVLTGDALPIGANIVTYFLTH